MSGEKRDNRDVFGKLKESGTIRGTSLIAREVHFGNECNSTHPLFEKKRNPSSPFRVRVEKGTLGRGVVRQSKTRVTVKNYIGIRQSLRVHTLVKNV